MAEIAPFRTFFFSLFGQKKEKRQRILKYWHSPYPVDRKRHQRVADIFAEFISLVLYEQISFRMRSDHFLLLGNGARSLAVRYEWLDQQDRHFLVHTCFAEREKHFKACVMHENMHFKLDDFLYNPRAILSPVYRGTRPSESHTSVFSFVWQREIVRDFVWMVMNKARAQQYLQNELLIAIQRLQCDHSMARQDLFLASLAQGVQGTLNVYSVPCWGYSRIDVHPEEAWEREYGVKVWEPPADVL